MASTTWSSLNSRRKQMDMSPSQMPRTLGLFSLTALGVGATLGAGAYVLVGVVANKTGSSVVVSFLIAALASIMSAMCYAEFGSRVPRAGSAYVYSYVTMGEILAFTTGFNLILEYVIGVSAVARAWSGYLDTLSNSAISDFMQAHIPAMSVPGLAQYPDFVAFAMTIFLSFVCAAGARESAIVNNLLTAANVLVIGFVIVAGSFYTSTSNFTPFAPAGFNGIFAGAATSFFAYVGFDVIATSAEEAKNPQRNVPIAIIASLLICSCIYMAVAAVITGMVPYLDIDTNSPLASAFSAHGADWAKYIIAVGAVCGLSTSLMTGIFPMPRIIYAIASDGLFPEFLGVIHPRYKTPVTATLLSGLFAATMALVFDINQLADMMSIGTLMSYSLVAASVLILRYRQSDEVADAARSSKLGDAAVALPANDRRTARVASAESPLLEDGSHRAAASSASHHHAAEDRRPTMHTLPPPPGLALVRVNPDGGVWVLGASTTPYAASSVWLVRYCVSVAGACIASVVWNNVALPPAANYALYAVAGVFLLLALLAGLVLCLLPASRPVNVSFVTPGFPYLPLVSIAANMYLLANLSYETWIRFVVWCAIGAAIYYFYGMGHSKVGRGYIYTPTSAEEGEAAAHPVSAIASVTGSTGQQTRVKSMRH